MVNFKVKLANQRIEKWKEHYIDYKGLQTFLKASAPPTSRSRPRSGGGWGDAKGSMPLLGTADHAEFAAMYRSELKRINDFYLRKMGELEMRMDVQLEQTAGIHSTMVADIDVEDDKDNVSGEVHSVESMKRSMLLFYRQLKYLQSFCILNYTGFVKILKKQAKVAKAEQSNLRDLRTNTQLASPASSQDVWSPSPAADALLGDVRSTSHGVMGEESKHSRETTSSAGGDQIGSSPHVRESKELLGDDATASASMMTMGWALKSDLDAQEFKKAVGADGELLALVKRCEKLYADKFCQGDLVHAQAELLTKQQADFDWRPFHLGYRFGACLILLFWLLWDTIVDTLYRPPKDSHWVYSIFPIYRAYFCLVLLFWLCGCCVFVWNKYRVNYIYIFEIDPRRAASIEDIFFQATNVTIIVMTNFLLYYKVLRGDFPAWVPAPFIPMLLIPITLVWALWNCASTWRVLLTLYEVIALLWLGGEVNFLTAFVADVMTSMAKVFVDLAYTSCVLFTGSWIHADSVDELTQTNCAKNYYFKNVAKVLVTVLPLYFRFLQNIKLYRKYGKPFPFLANTMKYLVSIAVSLFSSLHKAASNNDGSSDPTYTGFYILFALFATLYSYIWDVTMDWGLARIKHGGLRERLMFGQRWVYWMVICIDLVGRLLWIITLMPLNDDPIPYLPELLEPFLAALELCRRAMWGCFRLENEHLNNTGYRRVDGPVPDHFDTAMAHPPAPQKKTLMQVAKEMSLMVFLGGTLIGISIYFGLR